MFSSGALLQSERHYQSTAALSELRPAGLSQPVTLTAKDALTWESDRPATPEHLKPFQHYARQAPGTITRHHGAARDSLPNKDAVFGAKTKASTQSAAECMASCYPDSEIGRWKLEQSETVYASVRKEPLGRSPSRGYKLPEGMGISIPCGRPQNVRAQESANSTQTVIFPDQPQHGKEEDALSHKMYLTSHHSFEPGEQVNRAYDWSTANIDPTAHRFGLVDQRGQQCSVKQILQPDLDEGIQKQQQPVVSEIYDRHKATLGDTLGRPRLLGAGPGSRVPPGHVFGKPSAREPEPCVCELIRGTGSQQGHLQQQQQSAGVDPGLGKSLTRWRNTSETAERVFGLPSVRVDVPQPANRSVANTHNYGNEPTAGQLLTPPRCVELGVKEEHLLQPRSRQELEELLSEAGIGMADEEFDAVLSLALAESAPGCGYEECSLEQLMRARRMYLQQAVGLRA